MDLKVGGRRTRGPQASCLSIWTVCQLDATTEAGRKRWVFRRIAEKLRIVKLTLEPSASVADAALPNGVNAN